MKRMHLHIAVDDLQKSISFYRTLFGAEPSVLKPDYAKWMLDDPRVNFAISQRGVKAGLDHVGIQVESEEELAEIRTRMEQADMQMLHALFESRAHITRTITPTADGVDTLTESDLPAVAKLTEDFSPSVGV